MGDRWVSPPTYTGVRDGKTITIEARVYGLDTRGKPVRIRPQWTAADSAMVDIAPRQGDAVKITVQRAGHSTLEVAALGVSKELFLKAKYKNNAIQVDISQKP